MKIFRYALLAALMLGVSGIARATIIHVLDPSGFQMNVPAVTDDPTSDSVSITFNDCPSNIGGDGCFRIDNNSSQTITSLTVTISATTALGAPIALPTVGGTMCDTGSLSGLNGAFDVAPASDCQTNGNTLSFTFSGTPGIPPQGFLLIVESGISDADFQNNAGTATVTVTPEPSSLLLALTGMGPLGYIVRRRFKAAQA